ncbi:MAG TPA: hypothetical protein EYP90_06860 [Chromatiaceae bacterium]|nr:hypothetical protein [Chromatiaceae bacterium]
MKICIVCQKDVSGMRASKIREDRIIRAIRKVKKALNIATNNELYVSEDCISKHKERRRAFEKSMLFFGILAAIVVILMLSTVVLSGRFDIGVILSSFLIGGFILLFAIIFKYTPALESDTPELVPGTPVKEAPAKEEKKEEKPGPAKGAGKPAEKPAAESPKEK